MSKVNMMSAKDKKKGSLVPRLRFPEFRDEWTYDNLGDFLEEYSEKVNADTTLPIYSSTRDGLKAQKDYFNGHELINSGEYGVVPVNCFVYRHMSDDNIFIFNINLIGEAIAVSKEYPVFKAKNMSPLFLYYILNYGLDFKRFAAMQKKGGTRTRLYFSTLCSWKTLLPTKPEQQRIADCLSSLDERIAAETNKLDALKAHKNGLLKQLFPAEGETLPALRFLEFRDAGEWEINLLGQISENLDNRRVPITENVRIRGAIPYYGASGIVDYVNDFIFDEELLCVSEDGANLIARTSPIAFSISGKSWINNHVHVLKFYFPLRQKLVENYINFIKIDEFLTGMAQPKLNKAKLEVIPIPIPPTEKEEQKIADCLSSLDELITAQTQKIDLLKDHKKGLMQQLFPRIEEVRA